MHLLGEGIVGSLIPVFRLITRELGLSPVSQTIIAEWLIPQNIV
jgi:hypothetical protein